MTCSPIGRLLDNDPTEDRLLDMHAEFMVGNQRQLLLPDVTDLPLTSNAVLLALHVGDTLLDWCRYHINRINRDHLLFIREIFVKEARIVG